MLNQLSKNNKCHHAVKLKLALLLPLMLLSVFVKSQDVKELRIGFYNRPYNEWLYLNMLLLK